MRILDWIEIKKSGGELSPEQIQAWIRGVTDDSIPAYQMSALLMAMTLRGVTRAEAVAMTLAMASSGQQLDLSRYGMRSADKHSSGGVGDTTSFLVVPIVAACGMVVGKMSGRGLGHTGGTLDKLEAVPGVRVDLTPSAFYKQIDTVGAVIAGQTGEVCPADKKLYALRDVTGTVDNVGLIAASIMSKKLAAGAHNIVLDVKCGRAAFMKTQEQAEELAKWMSDIGVRAGRKVRALVTDMQAPLSTYVGNAIEVYGAIRVLRGEERGPLYDVAIELASHLLAQYGMDRPRERARHAIESGAALEVFAKMLYAQGATVDVCADPQILIQHDSVLTVVADREGYVQEIDGLRLAQMLCHMGGGREKVSDVIDPQVGAQLHVRVGDYVHAKDALLSIHTSSGKNVPSEQELREIISISDHSPAPIHWIHGVYEGEKDVSNA